MKKLFVLALAGLFAFSVYVPSLSYANKGGEPVVGCDNPKLISKRELC